MNKIGFIGAGKMACAIIKGIINSKIFANENICAADNNEIALNNIKNNFNIKTESRNFKIAENYKLIVLSVKPFVIRDVLEEIKPFITEEHIIISIAAGISTETIEKYLNKKASVIRVMPNTPALVNEGMSAICKGKYASDSDCDIALKIFESVGKVIKTEEKYIDIITAISGSGPAFYYRFIQDIAMAGVLLGLDYETSLKLSAQTAYGSAKMVLETGINPEDLIVNVTTPGGCTQVGNDILKENNIKEILSQTIIKTKEKAFELGKK